MTSNQNQRDGTVILTDSNKWIPWYRQIKMQSEALEIWDIIDPEGSTQPCMKPVQPLSPDISTYEPATAEGRASTASSHTIRAARGSARGGAQSSVEISRVTPQTPIIPARVSDLSEAGQEAYKEDREDYKLSLESYKMKDRDY
jgi:hypothetical protein